MKLRSGFTLLEMLVSAALLACLMIFLARIFMGADQFASRHRSNLQEDKIILKTFDSMRQEIGSAVLHSEQNRYLNMYAVENDDGIALYFCRFDDLAYKKDASKFIEYICYFWDKKNFYRASFKDSYLTTSNTYDWISSAQMQNAVQQAKSQLSPIPKVESFSMEFFKEDKTSQMNQWSDASSLPQAIRLTIQLENSKAFSTLILCRHHD